MVDLGKTYADAGLILPPASCPTTCPRCSSSCPPSHRDRHAPFSVKSPISSTPCTPPCSSAAAITPQCWRPFSNWPASMHSVEIAPEPDIDEAWQEPQAFDGCSTRARRAPTHRKPCISSATALPLKSELPNEPHSQLRLRDLSLHLPERILRRQPDPFRPGSIHLEERFLANAAHGPVALGQQPVPCRRAVPVFSAISSACSRRTRYTTSSSARAPNSCWPWSAAASPAWRRWWVGLLLQRRLTEPRIRVNSKTSDIVVLWLFLVQLVLGVATVPISGQHLDGSVMMLLADWGQRIVTFRGGAADLIVSQLGVQAAPVPRHDHLPDLPVHPAGAYLEWLRLARLHRPPLPGGSQPSAQCTHRTQPARPL